MKNLGITRGYADIGQTGAPQYVHYYACGSGPALMLLHASPMSAATFLPLLARLGERTTAIAIDTPGYGFSDPLPQAAENLDPYADAVNAVRRALGIEQLVVYGSATGAQIALEFSKRHREHCASIILDNCADFPDSECARMLEGYFPDLSLDFAGAHLARIWTMVLDLHRFFPWHWHWDESARLPARALDPNLLQLMALQYLQAGPNYDGAYRAAFANERLSRLLDTQARTTIIRSAGSLLKRYTQRFDEVEWPANFELHDCGPTPEERWQAVVDTVDAHAKDVLPVRALAPPARYGRRMLRHDAGNVSAILTQPANDRWLLLHDVGSSSTAIADVVAAFAAGAQVLAPDLPGHGASDATAGEPSTYLEQCSELIDSLLAEAELEEVSVLAVGRAASIALHAAAARPARFHRIVLVDPLSECEPLEVNPSLDGTHLLALWHRLRNRELYHPADQPSAETGLSGQPNLDPGALNRQLIDHLLSVETYAAARADIDQYPTRSAAATSIVAVTLARTAGTAAAARSRRNFAGADSIEAIELPADPAHWPALL